MKTLTTFALALMLGLPSLTQADPNLLRRLDDLTFDTLHDARQLRWLIREQFLDSPSFGFLLGDSQLLIYRLRSFEDSLYRETPIQFLFADLTSVRMTAAQLRLRLNHPGVCMPQPDAILFGGARFVIEDPVPAVLLPLDQALLLLGQVEGKLQFMEDMLLGRPPAALPGGNGIPAAPDGGVFFDDEIPQAGGTGPAGVFSLPAEGGTLRSGSPLGPRLPLEWNAPSGGVPAGLPASGGEAPASREGPLS